MPEKNGGPKKVATYVRVSTVEQAESGYSLAQQREALRDHCAREGHEIVGEFEDAGHSGATLARPGLDAVRDRIAEGGVDLVLAQDRDRLAREPAYLVLLKLEFEERGAELRALNDRGGGSPEDELATGVLDALARFERLKTAERTRRGLLRKAKSGKVIRGPKPNFGFRFNDEGDQLLVHEPEMRIVERIFGMAAEGMGPKAIQTRLYAEGVLSPSGKPMWPHRIVKAQILLNDLYRPHSFEEVAEMVSPEVAARLDPRRPYGIWWYNRRNVKKKHASEPDGKGGRRYAARTTTETRDREDWIAVPVPASERLTRDVVDRARHLIASRKGNERLHPARAWELKGIARCSCGQNMLTHTSHPGPARPYNYYRCKREAAYGPDACAQKGIRAEKSETAVWGFVSELLKDPERLRAGLDEMIEQERAGAGPDPEQERQAWLGKLADADRRRGAYQDQQAAGLMTLDELRAKITALDEAREIARLELAALRTRQQRLEELEHDRDALMDRYAAMVPEALDQLTGEGRSTLYRMLRLQVVPTPGGFALSGAFCDTEPTRSGA
jgi:site-specific DNA recombinase